MIDEEKCAEEEGEEAMADDLKAQFTTMPPSQVCPKKFNGENIFLLWGFVE